MLYFSLGTGDFHTYLGSISKKVFFLLLPFIFFFLFFNRFSKSSVPCTVNCSERCSCSWDIGKQRIYNITLTVENPLGKGTATDVFDVAHRSKSFSISLMKTFCGRPCFLGLNTWMPA